MSAILPMTEIANYIICCAIHTMAEEGTVDSMLVSGDRVAAVGTLEDVRAAAPAQTREIDARGRCIIPGMHEGHSHLIEQSVFGRELDLSHAASLEDGLGQARGHTAFRGFGGHSLHPTRPRSV